MLTYILLSALSFVFCLFQSSLGAPNIDNSIVRRTPDCEYHPSVDENITTKALTALNIEDDYYGTRRVSYFTTSSGLAIIDGDVVYGTEQQLLLAAASRGNRKTSGAMVFKNRTWPNAVVRYRYMSDEAENNLKTQFVDRAIAYWGVGAPWLRFERVEPNNDDAEPGILRISGDCNGCYSSVGYIEGDKQYYNIMPDHCTMHCGVSGAVHQLGHVLGMMHEHQRPDREESIHFVCENLDPGEACTMPEGKTCCESDLPYGCCPKKYIFDTIDGMDFNGPYDINSTMQYPDWCYGKPGKKTFVPVRTDIKFPFSRTAQPSKLDFEAVCRLYSSTCSAHTKD